MRKVATCAWGAVCALWLGGLATAQEPDFVAFSLGGFDVNDNETAVEARVEYRSNWKPFYLGPMIGLMVNSDGGVYGYGGVYLDVFLGRRWVVTPNVAVGGYGRGNGKDLGSVIEFRSALELSYRYDNRARLGIALSHISNASIDDNNPGTESLVVTFAVPFASLF